MDKESVQATSPKAYDQVLEYLKTLIKNKDISYGGKIPSERELMETLRISEIRSGKHYGSWSIQAFWKAATAREIFW